jgi:FixJ family two-component response regulator
MEEAACVFVVDDDPLVLRAVERILRGNGHKVEVHQSATTFLARMPCRQIGCVLLDLRMPGMDGLEVQRQLATGASPMPVIFFSGGSDVPTTAKAMREGALDFLVKPLDERELIVAVNRAIEKCASERRKQDAVQAAMTRVARLTRREREVCELVGQGPLNKQIADRLGTGEKVVKVHRGRAMRKLEITSVPALVQLLNSVSGASGP